jgi:pyruvate/2-oxoglutarate dehydrogenase complex dihydrolipoamide dehydrogenase (E3) component
MPSPPPSDEPAGNVYDRQAPGMTRFLVDRDRRIIIGCTITGPDVAEFLHAVTIAIRPRGSARALAPRRSAVPTCSELWLGLLEQAWSP